MKIQNKKISLIILLGLTFSTVAFAQAEGGATVQKTTLWQMILQGGWAGLLFATLMVKQLRWIKVGVINLMMTAL